MTLSGQVLADVARRHGLTVLQMLTGGASYRYAWPKQEAMWRLRQLRWSTRDAPRFSLPQIAAIVGLKHHATVISGIRRHEQRAAQAAALSSCWRGKWREQHRPLGARAE